MSLKTLLTTVSLFLAIVRSQAAISFVIEPDDYVNGTILNHVIAPVSLTTAGADNLPIPPVTFDVTASYDGFGFASTGTNVFGQAGVPFWNTDRRLRMDFNNLASFVALDFIGGDLFTNDIAQLDAYNSAGILLASYLSGPRAPDQVETLFISRPAGDIAWAVAYAGPGNGNFIRLDRLQLTVVPEPSTAAVILAGGLACLVHRVKRPKTVVAADVRRRIRRDRSAA